MERIIQTMSNGVLSPSTLKLIGRYGEWQKMAKQPVDGEVIQADEVASKVSAIYEKIKGVVDWREEHLLRKRAIERTLKRLIVFGEYGQPGAVEDMIHELIRGGYFANNTIEKTKIAAVQMIMDKYIYILNNVVHPQKQDEVYFQSWLLKIASYEIEQKLAPAAREETLMKFMTGEMIKVIKLREEGTVGKMSEEEKNVQIYIATQRALFKIDKSTITYYLLTRKFPDWSNLQMSSPELDEMTKNIYTIKNDLDRELNHPLATKFLRVCEKYDTPFLILSDIVASDPSLAEHRLANPQTLEGLISQFYNIRLNNLKGVMWRAALYSTISIFITKVLLALITEIPFDIFVTEQFHYSVLAINLMFPPLLMFLLVITARLPGAENLQRVTEEVKKIVYDGSERKAREIKVVSPKNKIIQFFVVLLYILTYVLTFGMVIYALRLLHFSIFSTGIFLIFLSTISFLGIKIRERGRELNVDRDEETIWQTVAIFFFFPVVRAGKWLVDRWSGLEITLLITILVDMPFLVFIAFIEQWTHFLRERREEIN